jgi:hypothetical protein
MNEEFGHLAGDAVLAQLGKRIGRRVRREDVFARTGGGEFCLVAPENDKAAATLVGERLLRIIGETAFGFDDVQIPVTLSIGIGDLSEINIDEVETATALTERPPIGSITSTVPDPFFQSASGELLETTRQGEGPDRFQLIGEALLGLARQRLGQAKGLGKGKLKV